MKLIITRHGETEDNKHMRWMGSTDTELSTEGVEQARKLALRLKEHPIAFIYTSPLKRARETAEEIRKYHPKAKLVVDDDLREPSFGIFEGLTSEEMQTRFPDIWNAREKDKMNYKIPGGESYSEVQARGLRALKKIIETGEDSIIVAHATVNKPIFMKLMNKSLEEISKDFQKNASVSIFKIKGDEVIVEEFNCDKHLKEQ